MYAYGRPEASLPNTAQGVIPGTEHDSNRLNTGRASVMAWLVPKALQQEEMTSHKWISDGRESYPARGERTAVPGIQGEREEEETCNHKSHHVPLRYELA